MAHLVLQYLFGSEDFLMANGMWIFLAVGAVALFGIFLPTATWMDHRHKEREAFYKAETIRRVAEAPGQGGNAASRANARTSAHGEPEDARGHENRRHHQYGCRPRRNHIPLCPSAWLAGFSLRLDPGADRRRHAGLRIHTGRAGILAASESPRASHASDSCCNR